MVGNSTTNNPLANGSKPMSEHLTTSGCPLTQLVDQVIQARLISLAQYEELTAIVLADGDVDEQERRQINRLFDAIQSGRVKIS
jgi:hypothetical protein